MNKLDESSQGNIGLMGAKKHRRWYHVLMERLPEKGMGRSDLVRAVARRGNVAESTVYSWLNGNREVSPEELRLIATEAGLMVGELLEEDVYYIRSAEERALLDLFRDKTEEERNLLLKLLGHNTKLLEHKKDTEA